MKKYFYIIILTLITFVFIITIYGENGSSNSPNSDSQKESNLYSLDFYNLYYALELKKLTNSLTNEDELKVIQAFESVKADSLVLQSGNIFDLWLYSKINLLLDKQLLMSKDEKELIDKLFTNNGFFLSTVDESQSLNNSSYILSTKMGLDIYAAYNETIPNSKIIKSWVNETLSKVANAEKQDFISYGSYLYLLDEINDYLKTESKIFVSNEKQEWMMKRLVDSYNQIPNSIEKFDTALNINEAYKLNVIPVDSKEVHKYLESIQLENGSFPIYGVGEADIMTTFLAVKIMNKLGIENEKEEKLIRYLNKVVKESIY